MMRKEQLEFGIGQFLECRTAPARGRRFSRSDWWFLQMRLAVERAQATAEGERLKACPVSRG